MAALSEDVKQYILQALACFDSQRQVIADVKERFGVVVSQQQVSAYDPDTVAGRRMSSKSKMAFAEARAKFKVAVGDVPIAHASYRLRQLNRLYEKTAERGNVVAAAQLLEQAAKDSGGAFTNRREHTGPGGAPIKTETTVKMDPNEAYRAMLGGK